jgi:hypothetical protein
VGGTEIDEKIIVRHHSLAFDSTVPQILMVVLYLVESAAKTLTCVRWKRKRPANKDGQFHFNLRERLYFNTEEEAKSSIE